MKEMDITQETEEERKKVEVEVEKGEEENYYDY